MTRQGWLVLAGGAVLCGGGRVFGVLELWVLGAGLFALVGFSVAFVAITRLRLAVGRDITPPRVYAGNESRVEISMRNDGPRRSPVLRLFDPVTGTRGADLLVAPLPPGGVARAAYRLPTDHRGLVEIGPMEVVLSDPFGLAESATDAAARAELTVFPRIDDVLPVVQTAGRDPHSGAQHPSALGRSGDEFYALREYVVGDDLRKVHWPSTARRDELMVRQDELPWQGRVTILLDVRKQVHTAASLELAISAAASVVAACWKRRDLVRLTTTDGTDFGFAAGAPHVEAIMEHLAIVPASPTGSLRGSLDSLASAGQTGALVVISTGIAPEADVAALVGLRSRFGQATAVLFDRSSWEGGAPGALTNPTRFVVRASAALPFRDAWNRAMHPGARSLAGAR